MAGHLAYATQGQAKRGRRREGRKEGSNVSTIVVVMTWMKGFVSSELFVLSGYVTRVRGFVEGFRSLWNIPRVFSH